MQIKNKVVVISGGASGLGEACVRLFLESGARVGIFDLDEEKGNSLVSEFAGAVVYCKTDVTDGNSVQAAVDATVKEFGEVNIAINCAGIVSGAKVYSKRGTFPMDMFNKVIQINLIGTMNMICCAVHAMMKNESDENNERGVIVNTSSGAAFSGQVGQAAYSASKAGVVGMTLPIAREIGEYGMRVVTIAPGLFETPMSSGMPESFKQMIVEHIPFPKRLGRPLEFALLARSIVENPYLNGTTIMLDGAAQLPAK
ncbi:MAG: SDR family NAD(P)-dependent oxidoreductase [Deltaproteobacteria bacterium]|nr:SDR family NAD(P)-dependent oxidoreductase [Deltaproteobacteria bacterium]